jgi:HEAT repeat protein
LRNRLYRTVAACLAERELLALASAEPSVRNEAVQALGMLQVRSSAELLRKQAVDADEGLKRSTADALFRLNDSSYVRGASSRSRR